VGASDAVILASVADGALLVMRLGQLDRRLLRRTGELLANARVRIIGGVLNGVNPREVPYGYEYYSRRREG
jgi:Mrp family chromosome partitioning ATPase